MHLTLVAAGLQPEEAAEVEAWQIAMSDATMRMQDWAAQRVSEEIEKLDVEEARLEAMQEAESKSREEKERAVYDEILLAVSLASTGDELATVSIRLASTTVHELALAVMQMGALPVRPSLSCSGYVLLDPSATLKAAGISKESQVLAEVHAVVATCSEDKTVRIWDADTGKCELVLRGHTDTVNSASFAPDNASIVTCSEDRTLKIWSLATGECLQTLHGHQDGVAFAVFSPDRGSLLSYSEDCTAKLWSLQSFQCVYTLDAHNGAVYDARFGTDGTVTTYGRDGKAFLWDTSTGRYLRRVQGPLPSVELYSYSPCGRFTVAPASPPETKIWNLETGQNERILCGHERQVTHAGYAPASTAMVAAARAKAAA